MDFDKRYIIAVAVAAFVLAAAFLALAPAQPEQPSAPAQSQPAPVPPAPQPKMPAKPQVPGAWDESYPWQEAQYGGGDGLVSIESAQAGDAPTYPGIIIVKFKAGVPDGVQEEMLSRFGAKIENRLGGMLRISVDDKSKWLAISALNAERAVEFAEAEEVHEPLLVSNDPSIGSQYYVSLMHFPQAWDIATRGAKISVADPNTGILASHPDFAGMLRMDKAWNVADNNTNVSPTDAHGTLCSGLLAAATNNSAGIANAAWDLEMIPVRTTASGNVSYGGLYEGIQYAIDAGARVVSVSWSGVASDSAQEFGAQLKQRGGLLFWAAGNTFVNRSTYPQHPDVQAIGATDSSDTLASFSTYGRFLDFVAPGVDVLTTNTGGGYGGFTGTSASTPLAASVAAYLFSSKPGATPSEVKHALKFGATDLGAPGYDEYHGYGRVDALGALNVLRSLPQQDTAGPAVSISNPQHGSSVYCDQSFDAVATDPSEVLKVEFFVNNTSIGTDISGENDVFSSYLYMQNYAAGPLVLKAKATDTKNNTNSTNITINATGVNSFAPAIGITTPADGSTFAYNSNITMVANASRYVGKVYFYANNQLLAMDTSAPFAYTFSATPYAGKTIPLKATGYDCRNKAVSKSISVTVGNAPPSTRISIATLPPVKVRTTVQLPITVYNDGNSQIPGGTMRVTVGSSRGSVSVPAIAAGANATVNASVTCKSVAVTKVTASYNGASGNNTINCVA